MDIKIKEPIQTALDSLEMALEHLQDQEEYTLNDVSLTEIWDIWEEASHVLGMVDDEGDQWIDADELNPFIHPVENYKSWPGLDKILENMNLSGASVRNVKWDEFSDEQYEHWVCDLCDKSTYGVKYEELITPTRHLKCQIDYEGENGEHYHKQYHIKKDEAE